MTDTRRVHVGNVPSGATEDDVRKCFGAFGKIEEVVFQDDPWSKTGRCVLVCVCDAPSCILENLFESATLRPGCTTKTAATLAARPARAKPRIPWPAPT